MANAAGRAAIYPMGTIAGYIPWLNLVVPFFYLLDLLWQLWDQPYRQCLHDKITNTIVVRT